ncbi:efflux RND transporter periplasmic adaptor subunit [Bordetella trematum]|uniref:efflux RND transporter periplasmic adaptor subunit n=1 Tax=Bordetella trematum TaxID=123899 RepID=UPI000D90B8F2|nr:efflux RND transporter periplasmic adaptor subunit [Bordetella trematum]SPU51240.1 HlyD family secretion protein [Bordetella trematum]VDH05588.1 Efflux pump periplasmic linker BepF [Bordetella trematum]
MTLSRRRIAVAVVITGLLLGTAALRLQATAAAPPAPEPPQVEVAPALQRSITDSQTYSGRLEAIDHIDIRPLVSGTLTGVHFEDGALVRKGDLLFTIDPLPYAAEVERAAAQLAEARAGMTYASSELARGRRLLNENAVARREVEEKQNAERAATARLQAAQAALDTARLHLGYTRITAPVDGRVSRAEITVGNVVDAGAQARPLTTLVSVARIYAAFEVDEQSYLARIQPARAQGLPVTIDLGLADEEGYSRQGELHYVDNRLDTRSGTIRVRAVVDNPDASLLPGLYARVRLTGGTARQAVLVDERAIGTDQDRRYVLALDAEDRVVFRHVVPGAHQGGLREIVQGLEPGERLVVNGLQRVQPGMRVAPRLVAMDRTAATLAARP